MTKFKEERRSKLYFYFGLSFISEYAVAMVKLVERINAKVKLVNAKVPKFDSGFSIFRIIISIARS